MNAKWWWLIGPAAGGLFVLLVAIILIAADLDDGAGEAASQDGAMQAGSYHCLTSSWTPREGVRYDASALGRIDLDGRGAYTISATGNSGRYRVAGNRFEFVSGPLQGWPAVIETIEGRVRIRLGRDQYTAPNPQGAGFGEHRCTLRR